MQTRSRNSGYEMDEEISRWILEFVVRQPVDDNLLHIMLSKLPLRPDDARLKKALLLRRIQSAVSNGSVSENVLDMLELVQNLDFSHGKDALESMKMAYCAVAVDCVVRYLDDEPEKSGDFYQAMKRIWKVRVRKIERSGDTGLISGKLLVWRDDLKAAIRDPGVCDRILSKNTRNEALKAVKGFLADAWEDLGPSFLEKAAAEYKVGAEGNEWGGILQRVGNDRRTVETGVVDDDDDARNAGKGTVLGGNDGGEKPNGAQDMPVDEVQEQEEVLDHQKGEQASEAVANAQCTIDSETQEQFEIAVRHRHVNLRGILNAPKFAKAANPPPEVSQLKEVSDTASKEPQHVSTKEAHVHNSDHTQQTENDVEDSDTASKEPQHVSTKEAHVHNSDHTQQTEKDVEDSDTASKEPQHVSTKEAHVHNSDHTQQTENDVGDARVKKHSSECFGPVRAEPSLKKRRVDGQSAPMEEDNNEKVPKVKVVNSQHPGQWAKPVKPSLMERNPTAHTYNWDELGGTSASVSPNVHYGRRMKRRWTSVEEDALREGVKKFGKGNWKMIQQAYREIFQSRSEVDLKDKWRNLMKR